MLCGKGKQVFRVRLLGTEANTSARYLGKGLIGNSLGGRSNIHLYRNLHLLIHL